MNLNYPILKQLDEVIFTENSVEITKNDKNIKINGINENLWNDFFSKLDGKKSLEEIKKSYPHTINFNKIEKIITALNKENIIHFKGSKTNFTGIEFWHIHDQYCRGWLDNIANHKIWNLMTEGKVNKAVILGFVIEKFHYIEGAYEHMAIAAANADERISKDLTRHFMEEYNHGDIYLGGLKSLFPKKMIVNSLPLPSTRALVNCLNELAYKNSFDYYAANELLQKTENIDNELSSPVETFYSKIESHYNLPTAICRSMRAHTEQDQCLGHQDVFLEMCNKIENLTLSEVNSALQAAKQIYEHLEYFLDGILTYYTSNPVVPRTKLTLSNI